MIKVLLVDDEQFIRQGFRQLVDWEKYGCHVAAEAKNGMEAIHILENMKIDLVFVDIKMPGMTGMELISYVRENLSSRIRFVILTGYAEFEYAKKALQMNVMEYMLKPVQKDEMVQTLKRINLEYQQEEQGRRKKYDFHISRIVAGKYTSEDLEQAKKYLGECSVEKYVSFEFDWSRNGFALLGQAERMEQQKELVSYLQSLVGDYAYHVIPLLETEGEIYGAGLLMDKALYESDGILVGEAEYLEYLRKCVAQRFPYQVQVYTGQTMHSIEELSQSFSSIRVARCFHGIAREEYQVGDYEDFRHKKSFVNIQEEEVDQLLEAVKDNDIPEIEASAERIFEQIRGSGMNMEMVNASIYHILYCLMKMVQEFDDETNQQEILGYIGTESFNKFVLSGSTEEITGFFAGYAGYLEQVRSHKSRKILDKVDEYVREHYMEKISLKFLGELFYVNNVYLGQLYKKKYGMSFRDYLNSLRMEKAQELLVHTDLRIYAIAKEVGFTKVEYFINKFVQANQMTPNQYRTCNRKARNMEGDN